MGMLHKLMPARPDVKLIADLDEIISQPIGFKFGGRDYVIQPVSTSAFLKITQAMENFQALLKVKDSKPGEITEDIVYEAFYRWIVILVPEIKLAAVKKMAFAQLNALMTLMIQHITGQTSDAMHGGSEKKKLS